MFDRNDCLLEDLGRKHQASKRGHDYLRRYDTMLRPYRDNVRRVLEIGLQAKPGDGSSIRMWEEFFPNAEIFGIDVNPHCASLAGGRVHVSVFNAYSPDMVADFIREYGGDFDLIIEDGSHWYLDQIHAVRLWWPHLKFGGYFSVEDIVTGDGPHRFIALNALKEFIDAINYYPQNMSTGSWPYLNDFGQTACTYLGEVAAAHFFRFMTILEKERIPSNNKFLTEFASTTLPSHQVQLPSTQRSTWQLAAAALGMLANSHRRHFVPASLVRAPRLIDRIFRRNTWTSPTPSDNS